MNLKAAEPDDCEAMARLHRACLPQNWTAKDFLFWCQRDGYRLLLAEKDGLLLGYVVARLLPPEGEIVTLAVAPEHRRRGVAGTLLEALMEEGAVDTWFLEVSSGNVAAKALYARWGFVQTGRRAQYYGDGTDALMMTRHPL